MSTTPTSDPISASAAQLAWQAATLADAPALLDLMEAFYAEEGIPFDGPTQGRALDVLLADPTLGAAFLLLPAGSRMPLAAPRGHLVLTRGHSLEFGGAFYLLDELYLEPGVRGQGEGARALAFAGDWASYVYLLRIIFLGFIGN